MNSFFRNLQLHLCGLLILTPAIYFFASGSFAFASVKQKAPVLVLYKQSVTSFELIGLNQSQRQIRMMERTARNEENVFSDSRLVLDQKIQTLWIANATLVMLSADEKKSLENHPAVLSIQALNRNGSLPYIESTSSADAKDAGYTYALEKMKVPELNTAFPAITGQGIKVGIIDTGIDASHPDLRGKVAAFRDFVGTEKKPYDNHGHGTHVAGTIAGGKSSGKQIGVAPGAQLVIAKAFSKYGGFEEKNLILAMQWMADPDNNPSTPDAPQVLSASWNVAGDVKVLDPETEVFCVAINQLSQLGLVSVFSAGNDGPAASKIQIPGACPRAVTVAATDSNDEVAEMSSRGPVPWKTVVLNKPDIAAPGIGIYSAAPNGDYKNKSGTSMATPQIAGLLALMIQAQKENSEIDLGTALYTTAKDLGPAGYDFHSGFGRADAFASISKILGVTQNNNQ